MLEEDGGCSGHCIGESGMPSLFSFDTAIPWYQMPQEALKVQEFSRENGYPMSLFSPTWMSPLWKSCSITISFVDLEDTWVGKRGVE